MYNPIISYWITKSFKHDVFECCLLLVPIDYAQSGGIDRGKHRLVERTTFVKVYQ